MQSRQDGAVSTDGCDQVAGAHLVGERRSGSAVHPLEMYELEAVGRRPILQRVERSPHRAGGV